MEENRIDVDNGKGKNNRKRDIILILVFVAMALFIVIGLTVVFTRSESKPNLTISDTEMSVTYNEYLGYYSVTITGVATNTSGHDLSYASVEYSVYDEAGNNLGTALDNINNLRKGESWRFEAVLFGMLGVRSEHRGSSLDGRL